MDRRKFGRILKTAAIMVTAVLAALLAFFFWTENEEKKEIQAAYEAMQNEIRPLELEIYGLQQELNGIKEEDDRETRGMGSIVLLFTDLSEGIYTDAYPQMTKYGFKGVLALGEEQAPGEAGCLNEQQFQELEDAARRQEDFIGSFAHELKTPLTSMIGYADMLRTHQVTQEEQFQAANYIFKEGKRLEALSFKLMDLMVVKNQELELRPVKIRWMAEDIRGMLQPSLKKAGIVLKVVMEDEQLLLEPDLMKTVLLNLLDNGRKAIDGEGTLYLLGRKEEEGFALYVRDTGKGIPKEELSRITEAFYMVDKSRSRQQGGAGLGLAICAEIVKRHEGTMKFKSIPGKGTMVRIFIPQGGLV